MAPLPALSYLIRVLHCFVAVYTDFGIDPEKYSPAGEDFIFSITDLGNIPDAVCEYANNFDVDEHIETWILARRSGVCGVPPAAELVEDARDIKNMLMEPAGVLSDLDWGTKDWRSP